MDKRNALFRERLDQRYYRSVMLDTFEIAAVSLVIGMASNNLVMYLSSNAEAAKLGSLFSIVFLVACWARSWLRFSRLRAFLIGWGGALFFHGGVLFFIEQSSVGYLETVLGFWLALRVYSSGPVEGWP